MQVWSIGSKDPLEKKMATHSSILAWEIPWTEEPGRLQSVGLQRVRHNWTTENTYTHVKQGILFLFLDDDSLWLMLDRPTYMYQSNYTTKLNTKLLTCGVWNIWIPPLKYKILLIFYHINAVVFWLWIVILPNCQFFSGWLCYTSFIFLTPSGHFILFILFLCP